MYDFPGTAGYGVKCVYGVVYGCDDVAEAVG